MKTNRPPVSFSSNFMKRITYSFTVILCSFLFFSLSGTYTFTSNMHSHMCQTVNKKLFVIQSFPLWSSVDSDTQVRRFDVGFCCWKYFYWYFILFELFVFLSLLSVHFATYLSQLQHLVNVCGHYHYCPTFLLHKSVVDGLM